MPFAINTDIDPLFTVKCSDPSHPGERAFKLKRCDLAVEADRPWEGGSIHFFCPACGDFRSQPVTEDDIVVLCIGVDEAKAVWLNEPEEKTIIVPGVTLDEWRLAQSPPVSSVA